ncbi:hypothetical protein FHW03_003736 [Ochrobactrum sp. RH2CCR150]|nr:hypothetical protein [Ochrobactrum sp. RH2CCR150]
MRARALTWTRHTALIAVRVMCLIVPILVALAALMLITRYDDDRNIVTNTGVPGATAPTGN